MINIPQDAIGDNTSPVIDWIEQHDRLPVSEQSSFYHERNQKDWWEQNKQIRELFVSVEIEIRKLIRTGKIPSVRILSWSQLAYKAGCNRATFKNPRRYYWVNERRSELFALLNDASRQKNAASEEAKIELTELERLKVGLKNQRDQTAVWYDKCMILEEQVSLLERVLAKREEKIAELVTRSKQF